MVSFVREDPVKTSDTDRMPDWTRVSEGYTSSNSAVGKALTNAGNTIKEGAVMLEQKYGEYVTERAKDTAALAEVNLLNIDQGRFHPDVLREMTALKDRKEATAAGGVSTESFNVYLLAKTKELKQRYPTFQDEIDSGLRSMGYSPAQDVIRDRQRQLDRARAAADDVTKRDLAFQDWALKQDPISYQTWVASGQKNGMNGLRATVASNGARLEAIKTDNLIMENKIKSNTLVKDDAERSFKMSSNFVYDQAVNGLTGEYASFQDNMKKYTQSLTTGEPDKAALDNSRLQFEEFKRKTLDNTALTLRNNPAYDKFPGEAQKVLEETQNRLANLGAFVFGKDYNSGSLVAALADNQVQAEKFKFANDPNIVSVDNAKKYMSAERYKEWAATNPGIVDAAERARVGDEIARVQWSEAKIGSLKQSYELMREEGVKDPVAYQTILKDMTDSFVHEKVPVQTKARIASYLFSPDNEGFMSSLTKESQVQLFNNLNAPKMFEQVQALAKQTGDISVVTNFKKNLAKSWSEVNEGNVETLANFHVYGKGGSLKINPADLTVVDEPVRNEDGTRGNITLSSSERRSLNDLNRTLRPIIAIWESAKVPKVKQVESLALLLAQSGLDLTLDKQQTTLDRFQAYGQSGAFTKALVNPDSRGTGVAGRTQGNPMNSGDRAPGLPRLNNLIEE